MIDLNFAVHKVLPFDGFGRLIKQMIEAMLLSGEFDVHPYLMEQLEWPGWLQNAAGIDHSRPTLFLCPPNWVEKPAPSRSLLYAMHESSKLPEHWADITNTMERLIVPCEWCEEVYRTSGVTIPISVVHPGIDFSEVPVLPPVRKGIRPYTFLALGDRGERKGWIQAYMAFFRAFRPEDNVSLIIKTNLNQDLRQSFRVGRMFAGVDGKVRLWSERMEHIRDIFAQADCLVYPTFGDGWAMFPREAAACGLPVMATHWSGTAVDCEQWAYPLNDFTLVSAPGKDLPGKWAFPDIQEIADKMRWCYEHQDEARAKGQQSAAWLRQHVTWEQSIKGFKKVLMGNEKPEPIPSAQELVSESNSATDFRLAQTIEQAIGVPVTQRINGHALLE